MRRIVDLSGGRSGEAPPPKLRIDKGCLLISRDGAEDVRIPSHELDVLVVGHRLTLTGAVLGAITANGGAVLALDDRFRPAGLMLPIEGNRSHAGRLRTQIERLPARSPAYWQQIVRAKVSAQAVIAPEAGLVELVERVGLGDPNNIEATAAKRYWGALFGDNFQRHADDWINTALNYGYGVLRALVARAVCAAGLHPALGIYHHHSHNTFALADDLMEPARPLVDRVVSELPAATGRSWAPGAFDRESKAALLGVATTEVMMPSGRFGLIEAYEIVCGSLVTGLEDGVSELSLPILDIIE